MVVCDYKGPVTVKTKENLLLLLQNIIVYKLYNQTEASTFMLIN